MSVKSALYHTVICDAPGCTATADDGGEYSSWGDIGQAYDVATDSEWAITDNDGDYCPEHSFYLESEDGYDDKYVPLHTVSFDLQLKAAVDIILDQANYRFARAQQRLGRTPPPAITAPGGWSAPTKSIYDIDVSPGYTLTQSERDFGTMELPEFTFNRGGVSFTRPSSNTDETF